MRLVGVRGPEWSRGSWGNGMWADIWRVRGHPPGEGRWVCVCVWFPSKGNPEPQGQCTLKKGPCVWGCRGPLGPRILGQEAGCLSQSWLAEQQEACVIRQAVWSVHSLRRSSFRAGLGFCPPSLPLTATVCSHVYISLCTWSVFSEPTFRLYTQVQWMNEWWLGFPQAPPAVFRRDPLTLGLPLLCGQYLQPVAGALLPPCAQMRDPRPGPLWGGSWKSWHRSHSSDWHSVRGLGFCTEL